ncbi:TonB-dependent receptor plug domain-containing protein [Aestuariibaculum sediminum]|uniref:TonB-dependent receptor plug domain-containing protein n=1 Tax=Aestuariibaculum sediminum TaxID=2770637 RepID=A0A8J6U724_9FLAO|nr:TonB-dependent receptor plug domain-containing protein [Aestuariibaculum sediminum]MBD0831285.1 TonB-dependent receptor plug domain-containing protein [Aestuariibaculum sediminum]
MQNHFIKTLKGLFLVVLAIISTTVMYSQTENKLPSIEKVYVHTDRSSYTIGETLWYKAYSVLAYNNLLIDQSKVLYVELISPSSKIIARNKTRLESGLGHGDFKLSDSLGVTTGGVYQLRAYTNWDRNFGHDFVFEKTIEIIDVFNDGIQKTEDKERRRKKETTQTAVLEKPKYNCQFFPEGGNLVENITSLVAFKTSDQNGNPVEVKGQIFDSEGDLITMFSSIHDGMGRFQFLPLPGMKYKAELTFKSGEKQEFLLPEISETGLLLSMLKVKGKDVVSVKTNDKTFKNNNGKPIAVVARVRGVTYFQGELAFNEKQIFFELPKEKIPEGICQVTVYDAQGIPQSERLVYIDKTSESDLNIRLTTDKKSYKPEEQVALTVVAKNKAGDPVSASFSVSSVDESSVTDDAKFGTTICSYYLMESDIRGKVHNPGFYFDVNNKKRLLFLDLLLLTQGWRDFLWKSIPEIDKNPEFKIEKGFPVSGTIKQLLGNKPKENNNITLALLNKKEGMQLFSEISDANGRFNFKEVQYTGKTTMLVNAVNQKGKGRGELLLDDLEVKPLEVTFRPVTDQDADTLRFEAIKKHVYNKYIAYGISPENMLDEVEIIAKKEEQRPSLYGTPDYSYKIDDNTPMYSDIYQLIQFLVPGVTVTNDVVSFPRFNGPAHIRIDDFATFPDENISYLNPADVDRIEVFKGASTVMFGPDGANGVILIYTKIGTVTNNAVKEYHSIKKEVEGFYAAREFYSPERGEDAQFDMYNNDTIKNTMYWNPYVHPGDLGMVKLNYKNSKLETNVKVTLEGITATGIPIVKYTEYAIEK